MKLYIVVLCEGLWWSCLALTGYPALLDSDARKVLGKKSLRLLSIVGHICYCYIIVPLSLSFSRDHM
jgi:hypothetical protein